jgi:GT2 family glycosyltransferase
MDLSIIIVTWNVSDCLKQCLDSIFRNQEDLALEVILIDNNSSDNTIDLVKRDFPQVKLIANSKNLGFAKACNQGLAIAQGKFLLLLNPDTKIIGDCLKKVIEFMDKNSQVGIAGCQILNPDNTLQPSVRNFPNFLVHIGMMFKLHHFIPFTHYFAREFDYHQTSDVEQIMGAFMMIKRSAFNQLGYMDEKYFLWFEEVDYCYQAKEKGIKVVYTPVGKIIHYGAQSFGQRGSVKKQYYFCLSRLRYLYKNSNLLVFLLILVLTPVSLLLTLVYSLIFKNAE